MRRRHALLAAGAGLAGAAAWWPEKGAGAKRILGAARDTRELHLAQRARGERDSPVHPPYRAKRRLRHDKIVGRMLSEPVGSLLGDEHPIAAKLRRGGRLSDAEKQEVSKAAHDARAGDSPRCLWLAVPRRGRARSSRTTRI